MNRGLIVFGVFALLVGAGSGYLIVAHPEGLNPSWPVGMALLAPAAFALGGLYILASGLGSTRFSGVLMASIAVCFLAIANWAAFFTAHFHCVETVSFFGVALLRRLPDERECRDRLRMIMACVDALVVFPFLLFAWRRLREPKAS